MAAKSLPPLRIYEFGGRTYQYREGTQPKGAVLVENKPVGKKAVSSPKNKARKQVANKGGTSGDNTEA